MDAVYIQPNPTRSTRIERVEGYDEFLPSDAHSTMYSSPRQNDSHNHVDNRFVPRAEPSLLPHRVPTPRGLPSQEFQNFLTKIAETEVFKNFYSKNG